MHGLYICFSEHFGEESARSEGQQRPDDIDLERSVSDMIPIIEETQVQFAGAEGYTTAQELVDLISALPSGEYVLCIEKNQALKRAAARLRKEMAKHDSYTHSPRSLRASEK